MIEIIPTTADVRDAYNSESSDSKYANRMFDLWLAQYKAKIVAKTEERIIELLEKEARQCEKAGLWANSPDIREQLQELHLGLIAALEVIKGGNK